MSTLFTNTYSGIITGGLGDDATHGMITMKFSLFTLAEVGIMYIPGGGPYPKPGAWNVIPSNQLQDFYKPYAATNESTKVVASEITKTPPFYVPAVLPRTYVRVRIKVGEKVHEKEYLVSSKSYKVIVNVANFINRTVTRGSVLVNAIKLKANIIVKIKNIIKRKY